MFEDYPLIAKNVYTFNIEPPGLTKKSEKGLVSPLYILVRICVVFAKDLSKSILNKELRIKSVSSGFFDALNLQFP